MHPGLGVRSYLTLSLSTLGERLIRSAEIDRGAPKGRLHRLPTVDPAQWVALRQRLLSEIKEDEDSVRFCYLGKNWRTRLEHVGANTAYDPEGPLVV